MMRKLHYLWLLLFLLCTVPAFADSTPTQDEVATEYLKKAIAKAASEKPISTFDLPSPLEYKGYSLSSYGLYWSGNGQGKSWDYASAPWGESCCPAFVAHGRNESWGGGTQGAFVVQTMVTAPITFNRYKTSKLSLQWGYKGKTQGTPKLRVYVADIEGKILTNVTELYLEGYTCTDYSKFSEIQKSTIEIPKIDKNAFIVFEYRGALDQDSSPMAITGITLTGEANPDYKDIIVEPGKIDVAPSGIRPHGEEMYAETTNTFNVTKINIPEAAKISMEKGEASPFKLSVSELTEEKTEVTVTGHFTESGTHEDNVVITYNDLVRKIPISAEVLGPITINISKTDEDFGTIFSHEDKGISISFKGTNLLSSESVEVVGRLEGEHAQFFQLGYSKDTYKDGKTTLNPYGGSFYVKYIPNEQVGEHKAQLIITYDKQILTVNLTATSKLKENKDFYTPFLREDSPAPVSEFRYLAPVYEHYASEPSAPTTKPFTSIHFRKKDYSSGCFTGNESKADIDASYSYLRKHFYFKISQRSTGDDAAKGVYALISQPVNLKEAKGKTFSFLYQGFNSSNGVKLYVDIIDVNGDVLHRLEELIPGKEKIWERKEYTVPELEKEVGFFQLKFEGTDSNKGDVMLMIDDLILEDKKEIVFRSNIQDIYFGEIPSVGSLEKRIALTLSNIPEEDEVLVYQTTSVGTANAFDITPRPNTSVSAKDLKELKIKFRTPDTGIHSIVLKLVWRDQIISLPISGYVRESTPKDHFFGLDTEHTTDRFYEPLLSYNDTKNIFEEHGWRNIVIKGSANFISRTLSYSPENRALYIQGGGYNAGSGAIAYLLSPAIDLEKAAGNKFSLKYLIDEFNADIPLDVKVLLLNPQGDELTSLGAIENSAEVTEAKEAVFSLPENLNGVGFLAVKVEIGAIDGYGVYSSRFMVDELKLEGKPSSIIANPKEVDFGVLKGDSDNLPSKVVEVSILPIMLTDNIEVSIVGENATNFTTTASELAIQKGVVPVTFAPVKSGSYTATLRLTSGEIITDVVLKGRAGIEDLTPSIVVGVPVDGLDFGMIQVTHPDQAFKARVIHVTGMNLKEEIKAVVEGKDAALFSVSLAQLPQNGGDLTIEFAGKKSGSYEAKLLLSSGDNTRAEIALKAEAQILYNTEVKSDAESLFFNIVQKEDNTEAGMREAKAKIMVVNPSDVAAMPKVTLKGRDAASFAIKQNTLNGQGGELEIKFNGTKAGSYIAFVEVEVQGAAKLTLPLIAEIKSERAIDQVAAETVRVYAEGGQIVVDADQPVMVAIYSMSGVAVYQGKVEQMARIDVAEGNYVVYTEKTVHKIAVRF